MLTEPKPEAPGGKRLRPRVPKAQPAAAQQTAKAGTAASSVLPSRAGKPAQAQPQRSRSAGPAARAAGSPPASSASPHHRSAPPPACLRKKAGGYPRKGGDVNLAKYDQRLEKSWAVSRGERMAQRRQEKFRNNKGRQGGPGVLQQASSGRGRKMRKLRLEIAKKAPSRSDPR